VGVSHTTAKHWFAEGGGMPSLQLAVKLPSRHLTAVDREVIYQGLHTESSLAGVARLIGRPTSTVTRELAANPVNPSRPPAVPLGQRAGSRGPVPLRVNYSPARAQAWHEARLARPKPTRLAPGTRLHDEVAARLKQGHSPEQICYRLRRDFPIDPELWVSHETIYQSLYVQGKGGLNRELTRHLRTGRKLRKPHRQPDQRRARILDMVNISERPAEAADRAVPGHWEGDLITGTENKSAIGTLVERSTRFTLLLHLPANHGAEAVRDAMIASLGRLPKIMRQTVTWDQGIEMAHHTRIAAALDLKIFFCDPASPWQRGTNENTNGLLRQYFPKATDLSIYPVDYLDFVAAQLNDRPRKTLDWETPAEAFQQLLSKPPPITVAMTG
jgi:IS30 family transposase